MSTTQDKSPLELLNTPAQFLKGVGPQCAELLAKLGLHYARDLLFFFPRDYEDMSELREIENLAEDQDCSVVGMVEEVDLRNTGTGKSVLGVLHQARHEVSPRDLVQSAVSTAASFSAANG